MNIRFLTANDHKISEAKEIMERTGIEVIPNTVKINEIQTTDSKKLVRDKAMKAFSIIGRPLFVEHTGLYLEYLNGLPGGLTQIFWDSLEADKFSELFGDTKVIAKTVIGYCDGKRFYYFEGSIEGIISNEPRGDRTFQWDCVFIPEGYDKTFAELGSKKNEISMRKIALDNFSSHLLKEMSLWKN